MLSYVDEEEGIGKSRTVTGKKSQPGGGHEVVQDWGGCRQSKVSFAFRLLLEQNMFVAMMK